MNKKSLFIILAILSTCLLWKGLYLAGCILVLTFIFSCAFDLNVFLNRHKPYNPKGRLQTEEGARQLDVDLKNILIDNSITFAEMDAGPEIVIELANEIEGILKTPSKLYDWNKRYKRGY